MRPLLGGSDDEYIANVWRSFGARGEDFSFDGVSEQIASAGQLDRAFTTAADAALGPLVDPSRSYAFECEEHFVKEGRGPFKLIIFSKRNPKLGPDEYRRYWRDRHGALVRTQAPFVDRLRGYSQNYVRPGSFACLDGSAGELLFDGMMQMWFERAEDMTEAFQTSEYRLVLYPDEENFIWRGHSIAALFQEWSA